MNDRHRSLASLVDGVRRAVLESDGALDRATRLAAAEGRELPGELGELARRVREEAVSIEDSHVAAVLASGQSEDAVFELILASAFGAADARLTAARRALGKK